MVHAMSRRTIIGVDVGGTNTDCVLVDLDIAEKDPSSSILIAFKTATTANTTEGIKTAVSHVLDANLVSRKEIVAVNIGTTVGPEPCSDS